MNSGISAVISRLINATFWVTLVIGSLFIVTIIYSVNQPVKHVNNSTSTINCNGNPFPFKSLGLYLVDPDYVYFSNIDQATINRACLYKDSTYTLDTYTTGSWWNIIGYSLISLLVFWVLVCLVEGIIRYVVFGESINWVKVFLPFIVVLGLLYQ